MAERASTDEAADEDGRTTAAMPVAPVAFAFEMAADVADAASEAGTVVVATVTVCVVTTAIEADPTADERAGQLVTVAAQL